MVQYYKNKLSPKAFPIALILGIQLIFLTGCASKQDLVIIFKNKGQKEIKVKYYLGKDSKETTLLPLLEWKVVLPYSKLQSQNVWTLRWEAKLASGMIMRRFIDLKTLPKGPLIVELSDQPNKH